LLKGVGMAVVVEAARTWVAGMAAAAAWPLAAAVAALAAARAS
jgi:hypothetical protein